MLEIKNFAPESDTIVIIANGIKITVWRDGISDTFIDIEEEDGGGRNLVLGQKEDDVDIYDKYGN